MEQYIPKASLLAEINKLKGKISDGSSYCNGWQHALRMLELSLDTLKVKEVDFEKEFGNYMDKYNGVWVDSDYIRFAKHFFELGLHCSQTDDSYIEGVKGSYTTTNKD